MGAPFRFFKNRPQEKKPLALSGMAQGLADIAAALEGLEIFGGRVDWHNKVPLLIPPEFNGYPGADAEEPEPMPFDVILTSSTTSVQVYKPTVQVPNEAPDSGEPDRPADVKVIAKNTATVSVNLAAEEEAALWMVVGSHSVGTVDIRKTADKDTPPTVVGDSEDYYFCFAEISYTNETPVIAQLHRGIKEFNFPQHHYPTGASSYTGALRIMATGLAFSNTWIDFRRKVHAVYKTITTTAKTYVSGLLVDTEPEVSIDVVTDVQVDGDGHVTGVTKKTISLSTAEAIVFSAAPSTANIETLEVHTPE
jgi:hypothetical protein